MGSKNVKAIVADLNKMPVVHDRKKVMGAVKEYGKMIRKDELVDVYKTLGTATMADFTNYIGGLPVNNFSGGQQTEPGQQFELGGDHIRQLNLSRGGTTAHACMPGCMIECSNVFVDEEGKELVSPVEYETIGLLGTNCGLSDPDELARINAVANDLGIDTIETGAMIAVLMEAGLGRFGDLSFMFDVLDDLRKGTEAGRIYARGTARVGEHFGATRIPVIKKQAISAYDPRVIEVTGITMMMTAQGADHTAGNVPRMKADDKTTDELVDASMEAQVVMAAADSTGFCIFGRGVTNAHLDKIAEAINNAVGSSLDAGFFEKLGRETLKLENEFNRQAGFTAADDELPEFFYSEPLPPSNKSARFHSQEIKQSVDRWWSENR